MDAIGDPDRIFATLYSLLDGPLSAATPAAVKVQAAKVLLAYRFGLPKHTVEVLDGNAIAPPTKQLSAQAIAAARDVVRRALEGEAVDAEEVE